MALIVELKRRKVFSAALGYTFVAWLILQVADVVIDILILPDWIGKLTLLVLLVGFPAAMVLAWLFDLTDLGIYREQPLDLEELDNSNPNVGPRQTGSNDHLACFCIVAMGMLLSVGAAIVIHLRETVFWQDRLNWLANGIAHEIEHTIQSDSAALDNLRTLFINGRTPSLEMFMSLSERLLATHPEIRAIEWAPRINKESVEDYVAEMSSIYPGYQLKMINPEGELIPADEKATYFPVSYTVPKVGNESVIGYDLSSSTERSLALQIAAGTGASRQSKIVPLVQTGTPGFLLFNPVYSNSLLPVSMEARLQSLRGFTLGVIDLRKMLDKAILSTRGANEFQGHISVSEFGEAGDVIVEMVDTSQGQEISGFVATEETSIRYGERWLISVRPSKYYSDMQISEVSYAVGVVGVLIAFLLAIVTDQLTVSRKRRPTHPGN